MSEDPKTDSKMEGLAQADLTEARKLERDYTGLEKNLKGKHPGRPKGSKNVKKSNKLRIEIDYKPRKWAKLLHDTEKRWSVLVLHRRAGKTVACVNHLIRDAMRNSLSRYAYIAPTYKQAKNVAWDLLKHYSRTIPGTEFNEVELTARYINGSKITLYGADNPDSLRGIGLWGCVFDEYSQQPSNIFTEIIRPALADHEGYAIWIGTPKGHNDFYRLFNFAKNHSDDTQGGGWLSLFLDAETSGILSARELEDARKTMSEDEFNQEFMCSFEAAIKGAYYADEIQKARAQGRIGKVPFDPRLPVYTVWDLGMADATAIGFYQKAYSEIRMIDYYEASDVGLTHYIRMLKEKEQQFGYVYGGHFAPHDIEVRELGTGVSRQETAEEFGLDFEVLPKLGVADGIHAGRMVFARMYIDEEKCAQWLDAVSQYSKEWDDKRDMYREKPKHDWTSHAADVHRYMAQAECDFGAGITSSDYARVEETRRRKHSGE
jgi:phage terminase large subunit